MTSLTSFLLQQQTRGTHGMPNASSPNRASININAFCPEQVPPEVEQWVQIMNLKQEQLRLRDAKNFWKETVIKSTHLFQACQSENQELSRTVARTLNELKELKAADNRTEYSPQDMDMSGPVPAAFETDAEKSDMRANEYHHVNGSDVHLAQNANIIQQLLTLVTGGGGIDARIKVKSSTCGIGSDSGFATPPFGKQEIASRSRIGSDPFFVAPQVVQQEVAGPARMVSDPSFMSPPVVQQEVARRMRMSSDPRFMEVSLQACMGTDLCFAAPLGAQQEVAGETRMGSDPCFGAPSVAQQEVPPRMRVGSDSCLVAPPVTQQEASSHMSVGSDPRFVAPPVCQQEVAIVRDRNLSAKSFGSEERAHALLLQTCARTEDSDIDVLPSCEHDLKFGFPNIGKYHLISGPTPKRERTDSESTPPSAELKPSSRGQSTAPESAKVIAVKNTTTNVWPQPPGRVSSVSAVEPEKVALPPPSTPHIPGPVPAANGKAVMLSLTQQNLMAVEISFPGSIISNSAVTSKSAASSAEPTPQCDQHSSISMIFEAKKKPIRRGGAKNKKKTKSELLVADSEATSFAPSKDAEAGILETSSDILDVTKTKPADASVRSSMSGPAAQETEQSDAKEPARLRLRILEPNITTLVIRNIPARYKQNQLLEEWKPNGKYDLLFQPYSFFDKRTLGYAFVNFKTHQHALEFQQEWQGRYLKDHGNNKFLDIAAADVQGYHSNLEQLRGKNVERLNIEDLLPALFDGMTRLNTRSVLHSMRMVGSAKPRRPRLSSVNSPASSHAASPLANSDPCSFFATCSSEGNTSCEAVEPRAPAP